MFFWELIGAASLGAWIYLLLGRGLFWLVREAPDPPLVPAGKSVAVVVPARNEEAVVGRAIASLVDQDYSGQFHIFLVDDHSTDATIAAAGVHERLTIVQAATHPGGLDRKTVGNFRRPKTSRSALAGLFSLNRCGHRSLRRIPLRDWSPEPTPAIWTWCRGWSNCNAARSPSGR